ncbi:MAG: LamG-like jellyroll fold domain-containing protein [Deltaproteobacteria bacterium]|nr:LamG-like jellyroll fold domain-containing protein [Deltaproteobacteria bacterium]
MERSHILVIAIVVAALALFGLRFFSSSSEDTELAALGRSDRYGGDGGADGGGSARPGERRRLGAMGGAGTDGGRLGPNGERGGGSGRMGAAELANAGGSRLGGGALGQSGSGRSGEGGGSAIGGSAAAVGKLGTNPSRKADLVDSLGSRPPTQSDLNQPVKPQDGDDIALKLDVPDDIQEQAGREQDVEKPDESEDGIKVSEQGRIEFPNGGNASGDAGSIAFKIKPEWAGADQTDNALVQVRQEHEWNNRLEIVKNGEFLRFILTDDTGKEADISTRITNWQANEEHDVLASWNSETKRTQLYIDNQLVGENEFNGRLVIREHTPMYVGADWRGSNYSGANATFYGFTVSTSPFQ